ncbi:MAG: hypothetical protein ABIL16_04775 [candidate division WOR-3 bacterium]
MTAKDIKDKAILVLILNLILPGLGHIIAKEEIAEALKRTGKNPNADANDIQRNGIIQLSLLAVGFITCGLTSVVAWVWSFIIDTLVNYYPAMSSVKDENVGPISGG